MVFVTGDCHGDFRKFTEKNFPEQKELTRDDIVIVCGDFGIWLDGDDERVSLQWLEDRPFTTVFVDGNHENFDRLLRTEEFPFVGFHGGSARQIRPHIYHLQRGEVFRFDGKTFWCFGGARSHDVEDGIVDPKAYTDCNALLDDIQRMSAQGLRFRIKGVSWWPEEMPTTLEMSFGRAILDIYEHNVDYVITHCCPQEVASFMGFHDPDPLTQYFNDIAHETSFTKWYFGHYHVEQTVYGKFECLYDRIERIV